MIGIDKVFLDTNFLVDALIEDRPQSVQAFEILARIGEGTLVGFVMPSQFVDFYYICRKCGMDDAARRKSIALLMDWCSVFYPNQKTLETALSSDEPDFEDGMIRTAAEQVGADFILSRDAKAFAKSPIPRIEPVDFLQR